MHVSFSLLLDNSILCLCLPLPYVTCMPLFRSLGRPWTTQKTRQKYFFCCQYSFLSLFSLYKSQFIYKALPSPTVCFSFSLSLTLLTPSSFDEIDDSPGLLSFFSFPRFILFSSHPCMFFLLQSVFVVSRWLKADPCCSFFFFIHIEYHPSTFSSR
jgi:hypothetical protein